MNKQIINIPLDKNFYFDYDNSQKLDLLKDIIKDTDFFKNKELISLEEIKNNFVLYYENKLKNLKSCLIILDVLKDNDNYQVVFIKKIVIPLKDVSGLKWYVGYKFYKGVKKIIEIYNKPYYEIEKDINNINLNALIKND